MDHVLSRDEPSLGEQALKREGVDFGGIHEFRARRKLIRTVDLFQPAGAAH